MYFERVIQKEILDLLQNQQDHRVIVLYGPRQVGKTTLVKEILKHLPGEKRLISGESLREKEWLDSQDIETLKKNTAGLDFLLIDEAQNVPQIGLNLKIMTDHLEKPRILATGSSSFELAHQTGEPLVGRKWQYFLFPLAQSELSSGKSRVEIEASVEERIIFGSYPEVVCEPNLAKKREILEAIADYHLFKDILALERLRKSDKIVHLLRLIAFQIGQEVSLSELAGQLHLNIATVERYLDLLEKVFVIKRVSGFSRNLRKEISKNSRFYFWDNGIRNTLINNFNSLPLRSDTGQLWENFLWMERFKRNHYRRIFSNVYFWRTYDRKEIDLIEEREGRLFGFEFKWGEKKLKPPKEWLETYPESAYEVITPRNFIEFVL